MRTIILILICSALASQAAVFVPGRGGSGAGNVISTNSNAGVTNIVGQIATNVINLYGRIGPGTPTFIAQFVTPTNVTDTRVAQVATNQWNWNMLTNSGALTNGFTNAFSGEYTNPTNNQGFFLIVQPPGLGLYDEILPFRGSSDARAQNKFLLWGSWVVNGIGAGAGADAAGDFLPFTDAAINIGNGSKRVRDYFGSRYSIMTPLSSAAQWTGAAGGAGMGITTDGTMVQFFRDTGITAAFNKERSSGSLQFDLAGNGLGFGAGISNVIAGFVNSTFPGYVQVGTTNSGSATPSPQGLMAAQAAGIDKGGSDFVLRGGPSTGAGTNGNIRLQTAEKSATGSSLNNASFKDRLFAFAEPVALTTNVATRVFNFSIPTALKGAGGMVIAHTEIENGVDIATVDETFMITANRKGSTVVAGTPSTPVTTTSTSGGSAAIVNTWTAVANAQSVDVKLTCVTSGILSTNSTVRAVFISNSSAVPVIIP